MAGTATRGARARWHPASDRGETLGQMCQKCVFWAGGVEANVCSCQADGVMASCLHDLPALRARSGRRIDGPRDNSRTAARLASGRPVGSPADRRRVAEIHFRPFNTSHEHHPSPQRSHAHTTRGWESRSRTARRWHGPAAVSHQKSPPGSPAHHRGGTPSLSAKNGGRVRPQPLEPTGLVRTLVSLLDLRSPICRYIHDSPPV